jgi:hypothetical protein
MVILQLPTIVKTARAAAIAVRFFNIRPQFRKVHGKIDKNTNFF